MSDDSVGVCLVWVAIFFGLGGFLGYNVGRAGLRVEAIEAGVAERTIDQRTGEVDFRFLRPGECPCDVCRLKRITTSVPEDR